MGRVYEKVIDNYCKALLTKRKSNFQNMEKAGAAFRGDKDVLESYFGQEFMLVSIYIYIYIYIVYLVLIKVYMVMFSKSVLKRSGIGIKNIEDLLTSLQFLDALAEFFEVKTFCGNDKASKSDFLMPQARLAIDTLRPNQVR